MFGLIVANTSKNAIEKGEKAQKKGQANIAISHYENAKLIATDEKNYTNMVRSAIKMAEIYTLEKKYQEAVKECEYALNIRLQHVGNLSVSFNDRNIFDNTYQSALHGLGTNYYTGTNGFPRDYCIAAKYYQQAKEKGHLGAQENLERLFTQADITGAELHDIALIYYTGKEEGITQDYKESARWFEQSAKKNCAAAYWQLGAIYEYGNGVAINFVTAAKYYKAAKEKGHPQAQEALDILYTKVDTRAKVKAIADVEGVTKSDEEYERPLVRYKIIKMTQFKNFFHRQLNGQYESRITNDYVTEAKNYQKAKERGNKAAQENLDRLLTLDDITAAQLYDIALMYYTGKKEEVTQNFLESKRWFEQSAKKNWGVAYRMLGVLYEYENGVARDYVMSAKYYEKAIEKGYGTAIEDLDRLFVRMYITGDQLNAIGLMYYTGAEGVTRSYRESRRWFKKSAEKHCAEAYRNLGILHENGFDIAKDYVIAAKCYQQAKEKGYQAAQKDLDRLFALADITDDQLSAIASMYYTGVEGVTINYYESSRWFEQAAKKIPLSKPGQDGKKDYVTAAKDYQQAKEQGKQAAQKDLDHLFALADITGDQLNAIGLMYYTGAEGVTRNYQESRRWFEKSAEKHCAEAYRHLGILHENGCGIAKNYVIAAKFYQQAKEKRYLEAQKDLDRLFTLADITGDQLNTIGLMYYKGAEGVTKNQQESRRWFEKSTEKGCSAASQLLGSLYENGQGVEKDYVTAAKYYQRAKEQGNKEAQKDLDRLFMLKDISRGELNTIGLMYYKGAEGVARNYQESRRWFEKSAEKHCAEAYRHLGILHENGCGIAKNYVIAAKFYQQAKEKRYLEAQKDLDRLFTLADITGDQLNTIGLMYYTGAEGVTKNQQESRRWFEQAVKKNCAEAHQYLGLLYEEELGAAGNDLKNTVEKIFKEYGENRKEIHKQFSTEARKKKEYKKAHRALAIKLWAIYKSNDKLISQVDVDKNTELHHAARDHRLKDCARLVIINPNSKNEKNSAGNLPFTGLNEKQKEKIGSLQNVINEFLSGLRTEAPKIIMENIKKISHGTWDDETDGKTLETLRIINTNDKLSPLLELTKLAILGMHDLSKREKFTNEDYDSDDDDDEKMQRSQYLTIVLDGQGDSVNGTAHWGKDGQEGCEAVGVYFKGKNSLHIAGKRDPKDRQGTFVHEITHFVTEEIFVNNCNPYKSNSDEERSFTKIAEELKTKRNTLPNVLQDAFSESYQKNNQVHSELIVRVAQMIATGEEAEVINKAKGLYDYYCDKFLPRVKEHCARLEARILSGWPKEMLAPAPNVSVALSRG